MDDVFNRLANALEPPRRRTPSYASIPIEVTAISPSAPPPLPKRKPRGDTSRDHAAYAAPHRPSAPPRFERYSADVTTKRIMKEMAAVAKSAPKGLGTVTIAFLVTVGLGLAGMGAFAFLR